jgi:uncharacterized protein
MLSFTKLLVLAIIVAVVWYGFKYSTRVAAIRRNLRDEIVRRQAEARPRPPARSVEDLIKCPKCGAFVSATGATNCGKPECPWGK